MSSEQCFENKVIAFNLNTKYAAGQYNWTVLKFFLENEINLCYCKRITIVKK